MCSLTACTKKNKIYTPKSFTVIWNFQLSLLFLSKFLSYIRPTVVEPKTTTHEQFGLKSFGHHIGKIEFLRSLLGHFPSYYIDSNINFCLNSRWARLQYKELKENSTLYRGKLKKMCQIQNMKVTVSHYSFILPWFHLL